MKKLTVLFLLLAVHMTVSGQMIQVLESSSMVGSIQCQGLYVQIELDKRDVEKAWVKYLKNYGKTESRDGFISLPVADIKAISSYPCKVTSLVESSNMGTKVWWAIDLGTKYVTKETQSEYNSAEKMLYEFAVTAYKDDIGKQIIDAEDALERATKVQEKEVGEGVDLQTSIDNNKIEKTELTQKLQANGEEYARLNREIDNNLAEQKLALEHTERIKTQQHASNGQVQSDEEKKALLEAVKSQQKKVKDGEKLAQDLKKNKENRVDLENKIKKNAAELIELEKKLEQNKKDQAAAVVDVEKMKRAVEIVKEKLGKIE